MKIVIMLLLVFTVGCGSIHIGSVTHTDVYDDGTTDSDEAMEARTYKIVAYIAKVFSEEEPFKGFEWDEKKISELEKKQKEKGATDDNFEKEF